LSESGLDRGTSVASLAATVGVVPRTLQRHFRKRTGLGPKRYAALQRFSGALRQVALGRWRSRSHPLVSRLFRSISPYERSGPTRWSVAGPVSWAGTAADRGRGCPI